jgi:hypothetical protein
MNEVVKMNDKEFLQWVYDRLENYGASQYDDYMYKLRVIIRRTPEEQDTH